MFLTAIRLRRGRHLRLYVLPRHRSGWAESFPLHTLFFSQLLQHGRIPQADSEQIVVRVAWRMRCQYEYAHHTRMALELGVPLAQIESLTRESDDGWSERTRTLMTAADELLATRNLSPVTFERLRRELDRIKSSNSPRWSVIT